MSTTTETTAIAKREEQSSELAVSAQQAMAQHEVQGAIILARQFPRNEDEAFSQLMQSCKRFTFAGMVTYSYPRGGTKVEGPSVQLAREAARVWGNIRYGADIVADSEESRTVRGWAWDIQTNTKETQDATFKKLIFRKKGGGTWIKPDERDLRELTNKQSAICVRNCLLHLIPPDLVEDALKEAKETLKEGIAKDASGARKKIIIAFATLGISVDDLESYLGCPLKQANNDHVANLREIYASISDGNSTWAEYVTPDTASADHKRQATEARAAEEEARKAEEAVEPESAIPEAGPTDDLPETLSPENAADKAADIDALVEQYGQAFKNATEPGLIEHKHTQAYAEQLLAGNLTAMAKIDQYRDIALGRVK